MEEMVNMEAEINEVQPVTIVSVYSTLQYLEVIGGRDEIDYHMRCCFMF